MHSKVLRIFLLLFSSLIQCLEQRDIDPHYRRAYVTTAILGTPGFENPIPGIAPRPYALLPRPGNVSSKRLFTYEYGCDL